MTDPINKQKTEKFAFLSLISLILQKHMRGLYMKKVIEYHIKTYVFKQLMKTHLPVLWNHLVKKL